MDGSRALDLGETLGMVAGLLTTTAFVPQALKTWRTRSAGDFSLPMLLMFVTGVGLWLAYGLMKGAMPVVLANLATFVLACFILAVKLRRG
jgi:MtN3 and saliva related transmembrane protein